MKLSPFRILSGTLWGACIGAVLALVGCVPPPAEKVEEPEPAPAHTTTVKHHRSHSRHHEGRAETHEPVERREGKEGSPKHGKVAEGIPEKVVKVLRHIDEHHKAPEGYEGGRAFHNAGREGEKPLPRTDASGKAVTYQEWDVNPKVAGVNRGAERLVTGSDGHAYYTSDHYRTFQKVR